MCPEKEQKNKGREGKARQRKFKKQPTNQMKNIWGVLQHSRLRIQHCHCSVSGHCCALGSIPHLETSACQGRGPKKLFLFFLFWLPLWHMEVPPGQASNLSQSCDLRHTCSNAGSLTHDVKLGIEPAPPQRQAGSLTHCATAGTL